MCWWRNKAAFRGRTPARGIAFGREQGRGQAGVSAGVQLLRRSTRRLELTAEGAIVEQGQQLLADWMALESAVTQQGQPSGLVRINASSSTGNRLLVPLVGQIMQTWPGLQLDLSFTDHIVDLIAARADIALRWGELRSSDMVARKLGSTRQVVVASPEYLKRFGKPEHPDDLANHVRIGWNYPRAIPHWPFVVAGQAVAIGMGDVLRVMMVRPWPTWPKRGGTGAAVALSRLG